MKYPYIGRYSYIHRIYTQTHIFCYDPVNVVIKDIFIIVSQWPNITLRMIFLIKRQNYELN